MAYTYVSESRGQRIFIATCPECRRDLSQNPSEKAMVRLCQGHERCVHGGTGNH